MRDDQASTTAALVALCRSVATRHPELSAACDDPLAEHMLPGVLRPLVQRANNQPRTSPAYRALRTLSLGLIDHLALRTGLIDERLRASLGDGIDQVVLLGAGFDARAYRLEGLQDALVFEVDHPATQAAKRRRVEGHDLLARELRYAACDFGEISIGQALDTAGLDRTRPSFWIWEGVTMYLPDEAVRHTIRSIDACAAHGSVALATYVTPRLALRGGRLARLGRRALGLLGEPLHSEYTPEQMAGLWARQGWATLRDEIPFEQARRFHIEPSPAALLIPEERLTAVQKGPLCA